MYTLNIVRYDPFDASEEAYIAANYADGERADLVTRFYEAMREFRKGDWAVPWSDAADARHYPDMAYAGARAGIYSMGQLTIRGLMRQYRNA